MNITFYILNDDARKLNKTLENGTIINCTIRSDIDLYNPILLINNFNQKFNYFEMNGLYYFITRVIYTEKNVFTIYGHVDVLQSFKQELLNSTVKTRQTVNNNLYYNGNDYQSLVTKQVDVYMSDTEITNSNNIILVSVGENL